MLLKFVRPIPVCGGCGAATAATAVVVESNISGSMVVFVCSVC